MNGTGMFSLPRTCHSAIRIAADSTECRPSFSARQSSTMACVWLSLSRHDTIGTRTGDAGFTPVSPRRDGGRS